MNISCKLSSNYAADLTLLSSYRSLKDGITAVEFTCNIDWYKGDHNPKGEISLRLFNYTIFELVIYNMNHVDSTEDEADAEEDSKNG